MINLNMNLPAANNAMPNFGAIQGCNNCSSQQMMNGMGVMLQMMMGLVAGMMGQVAGNNPMMPGNFGGAAGALPGSPINGFLGGGNATGGAGAPNAAGAAQGGAAGPAGSVGDVNVEKLVNAVDPGYRDAARQHWPHIVAEANKQGVTNKAQLAYILATTVHESGAGKHMEEFASGSAYEGRRDLGNTQSGDGTRYKGRGYVQITGRTNYADWSKRLGIDLVSDPNKAKDPAVAAKILVGGMKGGTFTGKKLDDYINGSKTDFNGARRIVNGTDKAGTFAQTAQRILAAMG